MNGGYHLNIIIYRKILNILGFTFLFLELFGGIFFLGDHDLMWLAVYAEISPEVVRCGTCQLTVSGGSLCGLLSLQGVGTNKSPIKSRLLLIIKSDFSRVIFFSSESRDVFI